MVTCWDPQAQSLPHPGRSALRHPRSEGHARRDRDSERWNDERIGVSRLEHGATLEIAQAIGDELARWGHEATVVPAEEVNGLSGFGAAVIGSGVYAGHWLPAARELVEKNATELAAIPVWLFSSGPVGDPPKPDEDPVDVVGLRAMTEAVDHRVFSGSIDPDKLGFAERAIVKALRAPVGDFRDWDAIAGWAGEIALSLASPSP